MQRLDEVMRDIEWVGVAEERVELVAVVAASEDNNEEVSGDVQHGKDSEPHCGKSLETWSGHYRVVQVIVDPGWVDIDDLSSTSCIWRQLEHWLIRLMSWVELI